MRALMQDGETFTVAETELGLEGGQADVTYTLRLMPLEQLRALQKKNTPKVKSPRTGTLVSGETDAIGFGFDCFEYCLVGWTGIEIDGQPAPCTREMKLLLAKDNALVSAIARRCGFGDSSVTQEDPEDSFRPAS